MKKVTRTDLANQNVDEVVPGEKSLGTSFFCQ